MLLGVVLALSLLARLVAIRHGLPHAYNADEELHYVPQATRAADGDWYSGYFENPSGFTDLLAVLYRVVFGGRDVSTMLLEDPAAVFTVARLASALLGTATVAVVYLAGRAILRPPGGSLGSRVLRLRLPAGLLQPPGAQRRADPAAADCRARRVPGALRPRVVDRRAARRRRRRHRGRRPSISPHRWRWWSRWPSCSASWRAGPGRSAVSSDSSAAALVCLVCLLALNPFIAVESDKFWANFTGQSAQAATTKLGQTGSAWVGYPVTLLWGFGVVPLLLAAVGLVLAWRRDRARTLLVVAFPVILYVAMSVQGRYFGRWMLPAYPGLAVLAGYGALRTVDAAAARFPRLRQHTALALVAVIALAQPVIDVVRSDLLLTRTDTRDTALTWMLDEVPAGDRIVVEPAVPGSYRRELRNAGLELYPGLPTIPGLRAVAAPRPGRGLPGGGFLLGDGQRSPARPRPRRRALRGGGVLPGAGGRERAGPPRQPVRSRRHPCRLLLRLQLQLLPTCAPPPGPRHRAAPAARVCRRMTSASRRTREGP